MCGLCRGIYFRLNHKNIKTLYLGAWKLKYYIYIPFYAPEIEDEAGAGGSILSLCNYVWNFNFANNFLTMVASALIFHMIEYSKWQNLSVGTNISSSPEPKAQVSFSDHNLSVVRRRFRRSRILFIFSSSQEPQGQFQPNLVQSILGWRGFRLIEMKGHAHFQVEIIQKEQNWIDKLLKFLLQKLWANFN